MKRLLVVAVASALLMSGCAGPVVDAGSLDDGAQTVDPIELIGVWRVTNAAHEGDSTWLRLADDLMLWNDCGVAGGSWTARNDAFLAEINSGHSGDCAFGSEFPADWLTGATGYGYIDGQLALLDAEGERLATLTIDGNPPTSENYLDEFTEQPDIDEVREYIVSEVEPLPADALPVQSLVGKWIPTDATGNTDPFLEFLPNGSYSGSDGCNGVGGRWVAGSNGALLATSGASTMMGCDGSSVPHSISMATTVGMVGDELTLYDADGAVLGALVAA